MPTPQKNCHAEFISASHWLVSASHQLVSASLETLTQVEIPKRVRNDIVQHNNTPNGIQAEQNYWGTTNIDTIRAHIYDFYEDPALFDLNRGFDIS